MLGWLWHRAHARSLTAEMFTLPRCSLWQVAHGGGFKRLTW